MDLSIIIAHYDPGNHPLCLKSFHKTLNQIESQKGNYKIEVIINGKKLFYEYIKYRKLVTSNLEEYLVLGKNEVNIYIYDNYRFK